MITITLEPANCALRNFVILFGWLGLCLFVPTFVSVFMSLEFKDDCKILIPFGIIMAIVDMIIFLFQFSHTTCGYNLSSTALSKIIYLDTAVSFAWVMIGVICASSGCYDHYMSSMNNFNIWIMVFSNFIFGLFFLFGFVVAVAVDCLLKCYKDRNNNLC
jgi:hypothetical protein